MVGIPNLHQVAGGTPGLALLAKYFFRQLSFGGDECASCQQERLRHPEGDEERSSWFGIGADGPGATGDEEADKVCEVIGGGDEGVGARAAVMDDEAVKPAGPCEIKTGDGGERDACECKRHGPGLEDDEESGGEETEHGRRTDDDCDFSNGHEFEEGDPMAEKFQQAEQRADEGTDGNGGEDAGEDGGSGGFTGVTIEASGEGTGCGIDHRNAPR